MKTPLENDLEAVIKAFVENSNAYGIPMPLRLALETLIRTYVLKETKDDS